jgi:hypothetical protein
MVEVEAVLHENQEHQRASVASYSFAVDWLC